MAPVCSTWVRVSVDLIPVLISKPDFKSRISSLPYVLPKVPYCSGRGLLAAIPYTGSNGGKDSFRFDGVFTDEGQGGPDTGVGCGELVEVGGVGLSTV